MIKPMKGDTASWNDLAKKYENFEPLPTNTKPPEWWVLWYVVLWPFSALKTQVQNAWNRLRHKPNPSAHTTPAKKKASPSANEDWIESFPRKSHTKLRFQCRHHKTLLTKIIIPLLLHRQLRRRQFLSNYLLLQLKLGTPHMAVLLGLRKGIACGSYFAVCFLSQHEMDVRVRGRGYEWVMW
jgi:hypothetical protein